MRKYFSGNYVIPYHKSSEDQKKSLHRNSRVYSTGIYGIYTCCQAFFRLIIQRLILDGETLNFDGGTLALNGETRPPYSLSRGYRRI